MEISDSIKKEDFNIWLELLKQYKGYFLSNPIIFENSVLVNYSFSDLNNYTVFCKSLNSLRSDATIIEHTKLSFFIKKIKTKSKSFFTFNSNK